MKTTAIWILAGIFGSIAVLLGQTNHLTLSICFGVISVILLVLSLIVHNQETKPKITIEEKSEEITSAYDERTQRGDKEIIRYL